MTLLTPNASVPFDITRLSHVVLTSRDLKTTRQFYEVGLGLEVTAHDEDHLCLRGLEESSHHSLVFERRVSDGPGVCRRIGYRVWSEDDVRRAHDHFARLGLNPRFVDRPFQGLTLQLDDGLGIPIEFCATMAQKASRMQRFDLHAGARLSHLDHIQISTHDVPSAYAWYSDLGFRLTEYTAKDGTDEMWGVWLKRKNNTQDVVFGTGRGPRLHHVAFHTPEVANVIHGADAMASLGLAGAMDRAPGRHGIGNAFFIYFRDPDGHRVETFTSHYSFIDIDQQPKRWDLSDTQRSQLWGFPAPRKWFAEATDFEGLASCEPPGSATPKTLEDFLASW